MFLLAVAYLWERCHALFKYPDSDYRLYSDGTEHFCGRGPQILTKLLEGGPYMKKIVISPSEPFLVIRVCQKCQKIKKHEKPGF